MEYCLGPGSIEYRKGHIVRLPEQYRWSVVLIGTGSVGSDDEIDPWGTGFLVSDTESSCIYLVTAAHVVVDNLDAPFDVRFNKGDGGSKNHRVDSPNWIFHPTDDTVDVAVHEIQIPPWATYTSIPKYPDILLDDRMEEKDIGAGNRTYTVGLWKFLHGDKRNQPFVYTGHIGLIPEDQKIPVDGWMPSHEKRELVEAYLIEGEPLDGASGSPVFVRRSLETRLQPSGGKKAIPAVIEGSVWLLGLLSDAYTAKLGEDYQVQPGNKSTVVPRGVNVVVPSMKIVEVLDHPDLKASREGVLDAKEAALVPTKLSAPLTKADNPQHREDFNFLVDAAVSRSKSDLGKS